MSSGLLPPHGKVRQGAAAAAAVAAGPAHASRCSGPHARLPHARMFVWLCAACAPGWRSGATVGRCGRIARSAERQQRARAAATRLSASAVHVSVRAMLSVRVPVHGVGESDRPNRVYSDMKCIFCEYLRPFAARGEHAIARARVDRPRSFMVSQACIAKRVCTTTQTESGPANRTKQHRDAGRTAAT